MSALVIGTLLAVGALAFVLYPLFFRMRDLTPGRLAPRELDSGTESSERELAVAALREIEFDHVTGKLSDTDYAQLKQRYRHQAVSAMRKQRAVAADPAVAGEFVNAGPTALSDDDIERALAAYRASHMACAACGPRPEADAAFCSSCGAYLRHTCVHCGRPVAEQRARFCSGCGHSLAA